MSTISKPIIRDIIADWERKVNGISSLSDVTLRVSNLKRIKEGYMYTVTLNYTNEKKVEVFEECMIADTILKQRYNEMCG